MTIVSIAILWMLILVWVSTNQEERLREASLPERSLERTEAKSPPRPVDPVTEKISQMSIDEKIGQLFIAGMEGTALSDETRKRLEKQHLGGVILFGPNMEEPEETMELVNALKQVHTGSGIPLFLGTDQEGGEVVRLPGLSTLPSAAEIGTHNQTFVYEYGALLGRLVKGYGLQLNFAPVLDIDSNPANQVIGDRAFGTDATSVSESGIQVMQGMQDEGVITAVKHFPGHGDTIKDSHEELPVVTKTREELEANELIPFQDAVEAGADIVLMSHIKLPKLGIDQPASFSEAAVDILRDDWEYDGVVITDDLTMGAITDHYAMEEVTVEAVNAGVDLLMIAHGQEKLEAGIQGLKKAVEDGTVTEKRIDESVRRILELKNAYGLDAEQVDSVSVEAWNKEIAELYDGK